ncbi:MAG: nitroreductase family protein [Methanophagales archaeon]|nr:nitroreductase family protein [Methanophagales archaeon]
MLERRSIRQYKDDPLTLAEVSQLLWSAQGITGLWGERTAPSAGATYSLEVYIVVGNVMCITSPKKFININRTNTTNLRRLRKGIKGLSYVMLPSDNVVSEMVPLS